MCCPIMAPAIENVVSLHELLEDYGMRFRVAVCHALAEQGYELGSELPNLQLAQELQASLGGFLEARDFEPELALLRRFLDRAEREGVLVDLSPLAEA